MTNNRPWRMPLGMLIALVMIVVAGTIIALNACAAQPGEAGYSPAPVGPQNIRQGSSGDLTEHSVRLSDGREVICITWAEYDYMNESMKSGMDCLEPKAE